MYKIPFLWNTKTSNFLIDFHLLTESKSEILSKFKKNDWQSTCTLNDILKLMLLVNLFHGDN